jgi:hypothetical protein
MHWCQLHDMNHTSEAERAAFLRKVEKTLQGL